MPVSRRMHCAESALLDLQQLTTAHKAFVELFLCFWRCKKL